MTGVTLDSLTANAVSDDFTVVLAVQFGRVPQIDC